MNARQVELPYVILKNVFQPGMACTHCDRELIPGSGDIFGNEHGAFCSQPCYDRSEIAASERKMLRGCAYAFVVSLVVAALILLSAWGTK